MNSHLIVKENLEDKLACSRRKACLSDGRIIYFMGVQDENYIRALVRLKPAIYYEWSKMVKEAGDANLFSMELSVDYEQILYIQEGGRSILRYYDYVLDRENDYEKKRRKRDEKAIPVLTIEFPVCPNCDLRNNPANMICPVCGEE